MGIIETRSFIILFILTLIFLLPVVQLVSASPKKTTEEHLQKLATLKEERGLIQEKQKIAMAERKRLSDAIHKMDINIYSYFHEARRLGYFYYYDSQGQHIKVFLGKFQFFDIIRPTL